MPGKLTTLAMFHDPMAAQMARNRLAAEGIPALLSGNTTSDLFGGLGGAFGLVHLQVNEEDLQRATRILDAMEGAEQREPDDDPAIAAKLTPKERRKRRHQVPSAEEEPEETTDIQASDRPLANGMTGTGIIERPLPTGRHDEDDDVEEGGFASKIDESANRAWKATVICLFMSAPGLIPGMACLFILVAPLLLYWLAVTIRLFGAPDLSPYARRRLYGALAVQCLIWLSVGLTFVVGAAMLSRPR